MVYIPSDLYDNGGNRVVKPSDREIAKYSAATVDRRTFLKYASMTAAAIAAGCGGGPTPPSTIDQCPNIDGIQTSIPNGMVKDANGNCLPNKASVSGSVTDRIAGGPIDGSTITYRGPDTRSAAISGGSYQISDLTPGNYNVTINGGSHVDHETLVVPVNASGDFPFSVLKWGSGMFGAVYDQRFDSFFNKEARGTSTIIVQKWDLNNLPPREIYVTREELSDQRFNEFMDILNEVNAANTSDMYGGRVQPLTITVGPPIGDAKLGSNIFRFRNAATGTGYSLNGNWIQSTFCQFNLDTFNGEPNGDTRSRIAKKYQIAHEYDHTSGASHPSDYNMGYPDSLMGPNDIRINTLSPQDKLARRIVYSDDTHPGNKAPDINPTYR